MSRPDNRVVLQAYLKSGHGINLVLSRQDAFAYLESWRLGSSPFNGVTMDGVNFSIRPEEVAALLVAPYPENQQQAPRMAPQTIPPLGSPQFPARA